MDDLSGKVFKSEFRSDSKITDDNSDDDWAAAMAEQAACDVEEQSDRLAHRKDCICLACKPRDFLTPEEVDALLNGVTGASSKPETLQEWLNSAISYRKEVIQKLERELLESNTILRTLNDVLEKVENDVK